MTHLLGFDIGGTKCAVVVGCVAGDGQIQVLVRLKTAGSPEAMMHQLFHQADLILKDLQLDYSCLKAAGVSSGGPLDSKKGLILSPPNLPGWDRIPVTKWISDRFGIPTFLQNDANACACAEWQFGAGKGLKNIVFLTFGTGMGAGLILNGKLYSGTNDLAGEVGHWRLAEDGPSGYGKKGEFRRLLQRRRNSYSRPNYGCPIVCEGRHAFILRHN